MADQLNLGTIGRDLSMISEVGGGDAWYSEVKPTGAPLATPDTWHEFPWFKERDIDWNQDLKEYPTDGFQVLFAPGQVKPMLTMVTNQRNIEAWQAALFNSPGHYFAILLQMSEQLVSGKYQYLYLASTIMAPSWKLKQFGNETTFKFGINPIPASITQATFTGVTTAVSTTFPTGASITVSCTPATPATYYGAFYTAIS